MPIVRSVPLPELWYVEVLIVEHDDEPGLYAIGPLPAWSDAYRISKAWEAEFGKGTTRVESRRPMPTLAKIDPAPDSARV